MANAATASLRESGRQRSVRVQSPVAAAAVRCIHLACDVPSISYEMINLDMASLKPMQWGCTEWVVGYRPHRVAITFLPHDKCSNLQFSSYILHPGLRGGRRDLHGDGRRRGGGDGAVDEEEALPCWIPGAAKLNAYLESKIVGSPYTLGRMLLRPPSPTPHGRLHCKPKHSKK
ncbi:hypothetical protein NL676_020477 [Syzygium grande]|nr:hypothetical protein NL676_020477 [Syzygium grande]